MGNTHHAHQCSVKKAQISCCPSKICLRVWVSKTKDIQVMKAKRWAFWILEFYFPQALLFHLIIPLPPIFIYCLYIWLCLYYPALSFSRHALNVAKACWVEFHCVCLCMPQTQNFCGSETWWNIIFWTGKKKKRKETEAWTLVLFTSENTVKLFLISVHVIESRLWLKSCILSKAEDHGQLWDID